MSSLASKIAVFFLSVFMIAYVGYQAYITLYRPYDTETVTISRYLQEVELNGYFVRDEMVLPQKKAGVIRYNYENAQKVSKNADIASLYQSEQDLYLLHRLEKMERKRAILEEAQNRQNIDGVKLDLLNRQTSANKLALVQCVDEGDFEGLSVAAENLMLGIDKFDVFVNSEITYQSTIDAITREIESLKASVSPVADRIFSEESGYFSNTVDGFEAVFTPESLSELTVSQVEENLKNQEIVYRDNIGRLARDSRWYFVALITAKEAELFKPTYEKGWSLQLRFSSRSMREVSVQIERLIIEPDSDKAAVIFSGTVLDENFVTMRFERPRAVIADYKGIVIPKEAIRIRKETNEEGDEVNVKGVYCMVGDDVRFKKANVLYEDGYVLVSQPSSSDSYISNYDQIIVGGKDLYDQVRTAG